MPLVQSRRRWAALAVVCLAMLMNTLDGSVVNVALPAIQRDLDFSQSNLSWVINAYLITFGSFLLLAGRLGDLIGRKRVFLAGIAIFTVASVVCGLAEEQFVLIAARFVQGLGGGSLGLLVGGVPTQTVNWHWIFFINIPIGIVTFVAGALLLEESEGSGLDRTVDVLGSILVTGALMVGIYAIVKATEYGWGSVHTLGIGGVAVALLVAFVALESRISNPIMPLRVFAIPGRAGSSAVRGFLAAGMWATFFLGALYLERVLGYGALDTGLAFMPLTIAVAVLSTGLTARMLARFGALPVMLPGLALVVAALLILATAGPHSGYFPKVAIAFFLFGLGAGPSFIPLLSIAMAKVPREDAGVASGIVNVSMQISAAIGIGLALLLLRKHAPGPVGA